MADELKRYDCEITEDDPAPWRDRMVESPDGDWVDAEAALAAIAERDATIAELREALRDAERRKGAH